VPGPRPLVAYSQERWEWQAHGRSADDTEEKEGEARTVLAAGGTVATVFRTARSDKSGFVVDPAKVRGRWTLATTG
jgi:hypothetical protein